MTPEALHVLYLLCAPLVAPATLDALMKAESAGNEYAVNINGPITPRHPPRSLAEALEVAHAGIRAGYTVDIGLMQVNSAHLDRWGTSVEQLFDPCANLRIGSQILADAYDRAVRVHGEGQKALRAAVSAYNTGDLKKGFDNGYVNRVTGDRSHSHRRTVPAVSPQTAATLVFTRSDTIEKEKPDAESRN